MANIRITNRTKTKDILPLLNAKNIERLLDAVPEYPLETAILSLEIKDFAAILEDEESFISRLLNEKRALVAFGRLKQYRKEIKQFADFIKLYDFKESNEEEQAKKGIVFPNMSMRMMSDCVRFFGLSSFEEAEHKKVNEWLAVFQNDAANALYTRRIHEIYEKKSKQKKKR